MRPLACAFLIGSKGIVMRPNIVFILADDLGWCDLSASGSTFYESPNIDRIATEGMRFTNAYATCQVCSPSRASIMTGKYTPRHGVTDYIGAQSGESWREQGRFTKLLPADYEHGLRPGQLDTLYTFISNGSRLWPPVQSRFDHAPCAFRYAGPDQGRACGNPE